MEWVIWNNKNLKHIKKIQIQFHQKQMIKENNNKI